MNPVIGYSSINEDSASERTALSLGPLDRVLAITGSGARVLDLIVDRPACIFAVDANPAQGWLLELKLAAARAFEPPDAQAFLGLRPCARRQDRFRSLRHRLSRAALEYWSSRQGLVRAGVLYCGRWERYFAGTTRLVRGRAKVDRLLASGTLDLQGETWRRDWDTPFVRTLVRLACSRLMAQGLLRDEAFFRYLSPGKPVGDRIMDRLRLCSSRVRFGDSAFATLLFRGRLAADGPLPWHLTVDGLDAIGRSDTAVHIVHADLVEWLERAPGRSVDAFSLSDVGSYLPAIRHRALWQAMAQCSTHGARICERHFLVEHEVPPVREAHIVRDPALESLLVLRDDSLFYRFVVARVEHATPARREQRPFSGGSTP